MKYLVVTLIVFAALVSADDEWKPLDRNDSEKALEDCEKEIGDAMKRPEMTLCLVKKLGVFTEDKGYDLDRMLAQTKAIRGDIEGNREIIASCIDSKKREDTAADWAYRQHQCMLRKMRKMDERKISASQKN